MGPFLGITISVVLYPIISLTVSFFVLFAISKSGAQGVKVFGIVTCVLLWILSALLFSSGVYSVIVGYPMMRQRMNKGPMQMMQPRQMPQQMQQQMPKQTQRGPTAQQQQ